MSCEKEKNISWKRQSRKDKNLGIRHQQRQEGFRKSYYKYFRLPKEQKPEIKQQIDSTTNVSFDL